jgi:hypothetical protein
VACIGQRHRRCRALLTCHRVSNYARVSDEAPHRCHHASITSAGSLVRAVRHSCWPSRWRCASTPAGARPVRTDASAVARACSPRACAVAARAIRVHTYDTHMHTHRHTSRMPASASDAGVSMTAPNRLTGSASAVANANRVASSSSAV